MINYSTTYYKQCALLVKVLPYLNDVPCFALKGGTAINFFHQDMPRLSVDIDLAYIPLQSREQSLLEINQAMRSMAERIQYDHPEIKTIIDKTVDVAIPKLQIQTQGAIVKVEVNPVFRGTVFPVEEKPLCEKAQTLFESYFTVKTVSIADLYAGKFCAALNRQHPRDLFDVKLLLDTKGISEEMRQAFVIYLACDRRPPHELLNPNIKPYESQKAIYENEFRGMVTEEVDYQDLVDIAKDLSIHLRQLLIPSEREFLLTVAEGKPNWELMPFDHLKQLSALQWKIANVHNMDTAKRKEHYQALEACLRE